MTDESLRMGPDGRPQLLAERCTSCVFRAGDPMRLGADRFRAIVAANLDAGTLLTCHQTLSYGSHPEVGQSACRGFFDAYGEQTAAGRFALAVMGGFHEVPAPGSEPLDFPAGIPESGQAHLEPTGGTT